MFGSKLNFVTIGTFNSVRAGRKGVKRMRSFSRKGLLKASAGGAVGGLVLAAPGVARAENSGRAVFVHIDGLVSSSAFGTFKIDIDVAGTKRDLRGEGWDADPDETPASACIFVQSGSVSGDTVELQGKVIFANDPSNFGALVETRANAETGQIDWTFGGFAFTGSGRVVVAKAELETDD